MPRGNFFPTEWMSMSIMKQVLLGTTALWVTCSVEKDNGSPTLSSPHFWFVHTWMLGMFLKASYLSIREALGQEGRVRNHRLRQGISRRVT